MTAIAGRIAGVPRRPLISLHVGAGSSWRSDSSLSINHRRRICGTAFYRLSSASLVVVRSAGGGGVRGGASDGRKTGGRLRIAVVLFDLEHGAIDHIATQLSHTTTTADDDDN